MEDNIQGNKLFITTEERDYAIEQDRKWLGLFGLMIIVICLSIVYKLKHHLSIWHIVGAIIFLVGFVIIGRFINKLWFIWTYEVIPAKTFMVDPEKNAIHRFEKETWMRRSDYFFFTADGKYPIISYAQDSCHEEIQADIIVNAQPLRIRRFEYVLILVREESVEKTIALRKLIQSTNMDQCKKDKPSLRDLGIYLAYEFKEKMASELSELYNPADADQQDKFRDILTRFIAEFCGNDCIRHGIGSRFEIYED
jgi:hypothetical protein